MRAGVVPTHDATRQRYEEALGLYEQIPERYSVGRTNRHLARIARGELVESLITEFGQL